MEHDMIFYTYINISSLSKERQKGVAHFKSAAIPFFNNPGTVGPRKLKFGISVGNQICTVILRLIRAWHTTKVLPCPF